MKKYILMALLMLVLAVPALAEPAGDIHQAAKCAIEAAMNESAQAEDDEWVKFLLAQPIKDCRVQDNADGAEATFWWAPWDARVPDLLGYPSEWLDDLALRVTGTSVQARVTLEVSDSGDVTITGGLDAFIRDVKRAAPIARDSFDLAWVRQAIAARLLPTTQYDEKSGGEPKAFEALCRAYDGELSPSEIQIALSLVKAPRLNVEAGPRALRLTFGSASGDRVAEQALVKAQEALKAVDKANAFDDGQLAQCYAEAFWAASEGFRQGTANGARQTMTVDFARLMAGDLTNDDFVAFVRAQSTSLNEAVRSLKEAAAKLPDYPRREQPATGVIAASEAGTKLVFVAEDDGMGRYVYLTDESGERVAELFLRSDATLTCYAPEGRLTVHEAKGTDWFGHTMLFGDQGEYSRSAEPIEVLDDRHYHKIRLGKADGNTPMQHEEFTQA